MKKYTTIFLSAAMLLAATIGSGCMGSWKVTKALYHWNEHATGNKYVNNIIFWVLHAVPVYPICVFVDYVVLNLIEFWTGSNPIAMAPGEKETQIISAKNGDRYEVTATMNRFDFLCLTGTAKSERSALVYNPSDKSWSMEKAGHSTMIARVYEETGKAEIFAAVGSSHLVDIGAANVIAAVSR